MDKRSEEEGKDPVVVGDDHIGTSLETPMRADAFEKDDEEKMSTIREHFKGIMETLGLDLSDDSLSGTPERVARMYVKELFSGLDPQNKPDIRVFNNKFKYNEMLVEKNITLYSACEHHFLPMVGKAHVGYISNGQVIGLSKINRIVKYYAKRPQVQERLSLQVMEELKKALGTDDVAVLMETRHLCVTMRGVEDVSSSTVTTEYSGKFREEKTREEFLDYVRSDLG